MKMELIRYAQNYDEIVNFVFTEEDFITKRIISYYQEYILGAIKANFRKIKTLDTTVAEYIKNSKFHTYVQNYLLDLELSEKGLDYYQNLDINLPKLLKNYQTNSIEKITITRWL